MFYFNPPSPHAVAVASAQALAGIPIFYSVSSVSDSLSSVPTSSSSSSQDDILTSDI